MRRFFFPIIVILLIVFLFTTQGRQQTPSVIAQTNIPVAWPQLQFDARHSGYVPQTLVPPYRELWRKNSFPVSTRVQLIVAEDTIFVGSNDKKVYALNANNGSIKWSYQAKGPFVNTLAYDNGKVFAGSVDRHIYALNSQTGQEIWKYKTGAPIYDTAAVDNGKVFFGSLNSKGYALNATTGALVWSIQTKGQGFRDRWTVAGNNLAHFTPVLDGNFHDHLYGGTDLFSSNNGDWTSQKAKILNLLQNNPFYQPLYSINQSNGQSAFLPPVLYASGGSHFSHDPPVLLPNGNANVIYRRSFGENAQWGPTTTDALFTGELTSTGDILPVDQCTTGAGGWSNCGNYKVPYISDESYLLMRTGDVIYANGSHVQMGIDTRNQVNLPTLVCHALSAGLCSSGSIKVKPVLDGAEYFQIDYSNSTQESASDGNSVVVPSAVVNKTFYTLYMNEIIAVEGTLR